MFRAVVVELRVRAVKHACVIPLVACLVAGLAALCMPGLARAEVPASTRIDVSLEYYVLPECPDATAFQAIVTKRLGYDPFIDRAAGRVHLEVATANGGLEGRVQWHDSGGRWAGERVFPSRSQDCRQLIRAMGFALAVQIQLLAVVDASQDSEADPLELRGDEKQPAATEPVMAPKTTPTDSPSTNGPNDSTSRRSNGAVLVVGGGSLGLGLAPSAAGSARLAAGLSWPHALLELGGELFLPVTERRADGSGFTQYLALATLAGCGVYEPFDACLLAKAGGVRVSGHGVDLPAASSGSALEAGIRVAARKLLGNQVFLSARVEGLLALSRWTVTLDDVSVWSAPRFAGGLGLDIGMLLR